MITFDNVTKKYPDGTVAVDDLTLEVPEGTLTVFAPDVPGRLLDCWTSLRRRDQQLSILRVCNSGSAYTLGMLLPMQSQVATRAL